MQDNTKIDAVDSTEITDSGKTKTNALLQVVGGAAPAASVNQESDEKPLTKQDAGALVSFSPGELIKNPVACRGIMQHQITVLLEDSSKIISKTSLVYERNKRKIGKLLSDVRKTFKKNADFLKWRGENFSQHIRILQEAEELAEMGKFAEENEGIPKNSLHAFARIRHDDVVVEFMKQHPAPVVNPDVDVTPRRNYAHTVTIYKRFHDCGIILTPIQATDIAVECNRPLEINAVNIVSAKIHEQPTDEKKVEFIQKWVSDGCPIEREKKAKKSLGIGDTFAQFKDIPKKYDLNDAAILSDVNPDDVRDAYLLIWTLAQKIRVPLSPPILKGAQSESADTDKPELSNVDQLEQEKVAQAV